MRHSAASVKRRSPPRGPRRVTSSFEFVCNNRANSRQARKGKVCNGAATAHHYLRRGYSQERRRRVLAFFLLSTAARAAVGGTHRLVGAGRTCRGGGGSIYPNKVQRLLGYVA